MNRVRKTLDIAWILLFAIASCTASSAFDSNRTIAQFAHRTWGLKDGAPSLIEALAQSADGYLWMGTRKGLYRFDGVVFELYHPQSGGQILAQEIFSLLALPNGDLWIGLRTGGICLLRNASVTNYSTRDGVPGGAVHKLVQDREGTIWAATDSGLARLEGNRWKEVGADWNLPGRSTDTVFLDRQGTLWVSTEDTLVFLPLGARRFQPTGIRVGQVPQIAQAASGKLWMAETTRSVRPIPLSDKQQPPDETEIMLVSQGILFDGDGALWITTLGDGLRRSPAPELLKDKIKEFGTAVESFTAKDGLSDDAALSILQDREGNIWVGTVNGLDRFSKTNLIRAVSPFTTVTAVLAAGDSGDVWVNTVSLATFRGGRTDHVHPHCDLYESAYRNPAGTIWWFCADAIYRYDAGSYTAVPLPPSFPKPYLNPAIAATEDGSGGLWMALRGGLFYWKDRRWQRLETSPEIAKLYPRTAFTDWMGRAWVGYGGVRVGGAIIVLDQEKIQRVFTADDLPVGDVREISGRGQHLWVGGELGLLFFDGSRFRRVVPADGEAFDSVRGVKETPDGSLWLVENQSIILIPASEVRQALKNPSYRVKYRIFDFFDGFPGTFEGTIIYRKEIQGTDGRLWFASSGGIVWIDPANILTNQLPPPVLIRSVNANGRQLGSLANLALPPRTTNLQIDYTALSLVAPERVRFRYMLEGVDKGWQDADTRREAFYTRLGPGEYHFRVIACNNDGVWNNEGARLDFNIASAWFQTIWFRAFCVCVFLSLLWMLYQLRLRQLQRQFNRTLEARVSERSRIARELHDTLLQSFQGVVFLFQGATNLLPTGEAKQRFEGALDQAEQAIVEGRDAVHQMRSSEAASELSAAISTFAEELTASKPGEGLPAIRVRVEGTPRTLNPVLYGEVYRIAVEALRNAFQHAQAHKIEVEVIYGERQLVLRVRDDGRGVDADVLDHGRAGHFGLPGMRERAKLIGASLEVRSTAGSGTEVELAIASSIAYTKSADTRRWRVGRVRRN